ncbi:MAG: CoA transferase [Pseudomonadota bacterium]
MIDIAMQVTEGIDWKDADWGLVDIVPGPTPLATGMPIADIASIGIGAVGVAAATVAQARGITPGRVRLSRHAAGLAMAAADYLAIDGEPARAWPELTAFYRASDGWVYLHAGFPTHTVKLLAALDAPNDREGLAARVAEMTAQEIEDRCVATNTCGRRVRTEAEWQAHPHSAIIAEQPMIRMTHLTAGPARPWTNAETPLDGVRVLDFSRVLAGPTIGRTLAEHGADVLRIASPNLPSATPLVIDTGYGKRSAFIDLETSRGQSDLQSLLKEADVVIDGYRPGALARHGLGPSDLAQSYPGLIHLSLSAFGETGPWGGLRGYDSLVQATTGFASGEPPKRLPCQPLDYLTGYLGAFAVMRALMVRAEIGAGSLIEMTLAGIAHWVREVSKTLPAEASTPNANPTTADVQEELCNTPSDFGQIRSVRPALDVPWRPRTWAPPVPLGASPPKWA